MRLIDGDQSDAGTMDAQKVFKESVGFGPFR
jgi:hypothetical protein